MADTQALTQDESVVAQVDKLQSKDSPLMRKAVADSNGAMNRRGMLNSSIATGAGIGAGLGAVVPLASQEASAALSKTTQANAIAAQDRSTYAQTLLGLQGNYTQGIGQTLADRKLAASTRQAAQADMASLYKSSQQQLASLYGVTLNW